MNATQPIHSPVAPTVGTAVMLERRELSEPAKAALIEAQRAKDKRTPAQRFDLTPHLDEEFLDEVRRKAKGWKPGNAVSTVRDALDEAESDWEELKIHLVAVFLE